ncbi:MAG: phage terminase large subunit family protein [Chromatiales bacterium]
MFSPPKSIPTAEWISEYFYLPSESGDVSGLYDFYYTPYFLGVAAALDDPSVDEVALMKAAQIGWTYFLIAYICKRIWAASTGKQCPILILFAKEKDGKAFHDEKLVTTIPVNRVLDGLIDVSTSRKSGNRWDFKRFINGFLKMVGSNSPGNVKSTSSVGVVVIEEPDDTSENVKEQGDAIGLAEERLKRYVGSKMIVGGTPALKGLSRTEQRVNLSDARVLPITCHACGAKHVLDFDNAHWIGKDDEAKADTDTGEISAEHHDVYGFAQPDTAVYICPLCDAEWDDYQRQKNIRETIFRADAEGDPLKGWTPTKPFHGKAGFMELGEVYSCLPGSGLAEVVREYLNADYHSSIGDETKRIKFVNQKLGKPYEFKGEQAEPDVLREAALEYNELLIPSGGLLLTAGVDVQHDRIAIVIRAWGRGEESWNVYWGEIFAEHSTIDPKDKVWTELEQKLYRSITSEAGWKAHISAISIDASDGTTSEAVYVWVRRVERKYRQILTMAIKDSSNQTDPEIFSTSRVKSIDHRNPKRATKADKFGIKVYQVGTNKAKDWISGQMQLEVKGYGRWHYYQNIRADYFEQITGEVKAPHRSIRNRRVWQQKSGRAVEGWDCEVYALHAARARRVHLLRSDQWDALERQNVQVDLFSANKPETENVSQETQQQQPAEKQSGWMGKRNKGGWMRR